MAASDPYQQPDGQPEQPDTSGGVSPRQPGQPLQSQPPYDGQQYPQAQPASPQYPQAQPVQQQHPQVAPQGQVAGSTATRPVLVKGRKSTTAVHERAAEPEEEISTVALKSAPPWLISALVHMLVMIVLGLILLPEIVKNQIELNTVWAESLGEQLEFDSFLAGTDDEKVEEPILTEENLPQVEDPFAAPPEVDVMADGTTSSSEIESTHIGMALNGREEGMKKALLAAYGGTGTTEAAVQSGLRWLAGVQQKNGSWSLTGPYTNGAINENEVAATAMALLAFQGAGNTHKRGDFKQNVARGWNWLLDEQDADGNFYHEGPFHHRFYTNGQAAIALCELYGMTKDEKFHEPAERVVNYLIQSQSSEGGWKYAPQGRSDVSVTGWVVMALQSARMAYLKVPEDNLRRVERYLDKVGSSGGTRYPYERGKEPTNVMTAEALLCRQYLGWARDDERLLDGVKYLTQPENLINYYKDPNVYFWYYATQVCHHMEGEHWNKWNSVMRQAIPEQQVERGREAGSWDPTKPRLDAWEDHGGRLYVTCLSIYMLEVYYRHLPIYSKVYSYMHAM